MRRKPKPNWKSKRWKSSRRRKSDWEFYRCGGLLVVAVFVFFVLWPSKNPATALAVSSSRTSSFQCKVASITDGDTLRCQDGARVRLHAVAARESDETCSPGHPCPSASAALATAKLSELAGGQTLQCQPTGTSYNRVTAICRNQSDVEINCAMVQSGTTLVWPRFNEQRAICR